MNKRTRGIVILAVALALVGGCLGIGSYRQASEDERVETTTEELRSHFAETEIDVPEMWTEYQLESMAAWTDPDWDFRGGALAPLEIPSATIRQVNRHGDGLAVRYHPDGNSANSCVQALLSSEGVLYDTSQRTCS